MKGERIMAELSNQEYIARIYDETYMYITKYFTLKCRYTSDIPDLLQSTYLEFVTQLEQKGQSHILIPKYYVLRIAKAQLAKYYEGKNKIRQDSYEQLQEEGLENAEVYEEYLLEDVAENSIISGQIWETINTFDNLTIKIFILKFMHNMHMSEISKEMKVPLSTVRNRLYRGIERIRQHNREEEL